MSKQAIGRRLFLLACLSTVVMVGGCSRESAQPPASPAAAARQEETDFDVKPVLAAFFASMPADWREVPAATVANSKPFVVDVREPGIYSRGFIAGAVNIPIRELADSLQALPALDGQIVVVCDTGHRGAIGMAILQLLGYKNAGSLRGGMQAWKEAKLPVATSPVPARAAGQTAQVNEQLRAVLSYYLRKTLPFDDGALTLAALTEDQLRKSSAELEATADTYDQGRSLLVSVDTPAEFAKSGLAKTLNLPLRDIVSGLDNVPLPDVIGWACGVPDAYKPEPKLTRFTVVSTSGHRAALGMMTMHLLGFHFVSGLDGDVGAWRRVGPVAVA